MKVSSSRPSLPKKTSPTADALSVEVRPTGPLVAVKTYTVLVSTDLQESRYDTICLSQLAGAGVIKTSWDDCGCETYFHLMKSADLEPLDDWIAPKKGHGECSCSFPTSNCGGTGFCDTF